MNYYLLGKNKKPKGPYPLARLRDLWKAGKIPAGTLCCEKGDKKWLPIEDIEAITDRPIAGGATEKSKTVSQLPLKLLIACVATLLVAGIGYLIFSQGNETPGNKAGLQIITQPKDLNVTAGSAATFSVSVEGDGLKYQWRKNGNEIKNATSPSYTIHNVHPSDEGNYTCLVGKKAGKLISNSGLDSTKAGELISISATLKVIPFQRGVGWRDEAMEKGATKEVFNAIDLGLAWLAKVQEEDGRWDSTKWGGGGHDLGCTGLALLAFLGDGNSHVQGKYRDNVKRALDWIASQQKENGSLGWKTFYEQGIAAMALCEAYSLSRDSRYYNAAKLSIKHIIDKMGPDGGFGYNGPGSDTSVTGWQIMALKSAQQADIHIPKDVWNKLKVYLEKSINPNGSTGYTYNTSPRNSMTAIGMFCRIFLKYPKEDPNIAKARDLLHAAGPVLPNQYYLYYATYCMFQMGGDYWSKWNIKFRDPLIALQEKTGENMGSWGGWQYNAGRVYSTALNLMSLEVYQRFLPVYR